MIKTVFIGTSEFAVPILEELISLDYIDLKSIVTQPDKPTGRRQNINFPPVKQFTINVNKRSLLFQPRKINEHVDTIKKLDPELIIVASYGQIISSAILKYPKYGCLNFHGSLLPKLRGAVPIQMSILRGFQNTGVTLQKMVYEMDAGDIISAREIELHGDETTESLTYTLSELARDILKEDLEEWIRGEIELVSQDSKKATFCFKDNIRKEKAQITEEHTPLEVDRMVRAFYPWPISWIEIPNGKYRGKRLKIFKAQVFNQKEKQNVFKIVANDGHLQLLLNYSAINLLEVQLEGKKRDFGQNYLWLVR